jgi:hypothetical protein
MVHRLIMAAIAAVLVLPSIAPAQSASVDTQTQIQMEATRKRLIVRPEPPMGTAIRDAERAAAEESATRFARDANPVVPRDPQLDYDVTNAIQTRNIQKAIPQTRTNR